MGLHGDASEEVVIDLMRNGAWLPPQEHHARACEAASATGMVTLNLEGIDSLDGGSLQLLLALAIERKRQGRPLRLINVSPRLLQWFSCAGCAESTFDVLGDRMQ